MTPKPRISTGKAQTLDSSRRVWPCHDPARRKSRRSLSKRAEASEAEVAQQRPIVKESYCDGLRADCDCELPTRGLEAIQKGNSRNSMLRVDLDRNDRSARWKATLTWRSAAAPALALGISNSPVAGWSDEPSRPDSLLLQMYLSNMPDSTLHRLAPAATPKYPPSIP